MSIEVIPAPRRTIFLLFLLLLTTDQTAPAQETNSASRPSRRPTPYAQGIAAWRKGDTNAAVALLSKIPESDPDFLRAMTGLGLALFAEGVDQPGRGLAFVERAYRKAPDNMDVVHAYIRCQLLARTNLSEPFVPREPPARIAPEFRFITDAPKFKDRSQPFRRARLLADLDYLEVAIANAYSYADRRGADWRGALDALRASLADETPLATFALRLGRFFTLFGDPHSTVRARAGTPPAGLTPFLPRPDGERVLAVKTDYSAFLDDECRYLAGIDGVEITDWLRVAGFDVPKASPQWERRETVSALRQLNYLRTELGLPLTNHVKITLVSADGKTRKDVMLPVAEKPSTARARSRGETRRLEGDIGYLIIRSMDSEPSFLAGLDQAMQKFRDTRALIIDVRGNSGGSQDAVRTILPYFLKPGAPMKIINVAAYRLPVALPQPCAEGYLGLYGRGLHPVTSRNWSPEERTQIEEFLRRFTPDWPLPAGKFSAWHVMGLSAASNPKAYYYDKPVIVLCDAGCFSATDNFLGALQGQPNVTLLGAPSGGGSGRMGSYVLPQTRLPITLCQMASFRANGDLFDGRGVNPDVRLEPKSDDVLVSGRDSVLDAALARLQGPRDKSSAR